jgi:PAS domain S-box-containing protein
VAQSYLREARYCYLRWGALGKVQQLDQRYPAIEEQASLRPTTPIGTSVEQLDIGTVMKASQAVSGEIVLENLIETLRTIAVQHAGAERGLLILPQGEALQIAAEAATNRESVSVRFRQVPATSAELPESILRYVVRSKKSIILDDALTPNQFSTDDYLRRKRPRSVLCLPLVKQTQLIGGLYLENDLTPHVFTSARLAVLNLLASQAAISLENARLYADLQKENAERKWAEEGMQRQKAHLDQLFELAPGSIVLVDANNEITRMNREFTRVFGYSPEEALGRKLHELVVPDDQRSGFDENMSRLAAAQRVDSEMVRRRKNGQRLDVSIAASPVPLSGGQIGTLVIYRDITSRKKAEEELRLSEANLLKTQAELAHVTRVTTMGEFAASIAHEVNQPIAGVVTNGSACLRWLARVKGESADLAEARQAVQRIIRDGARAGEVIARIRTLLSGATFQFTLSTHPPRNIGAARNPYIAAGGGSNVAPTRLITAGAAVRFRQQNIRGMSIDECLKRASDGVPKTSFSKTIFQMLAYPLKKCLPKNLQFFPPNGDGLSGQPFNLGGRQLLSNRRIDLICLLVA